MADQLPDNLVVDIPITLPEELVTVLAENQHVRIERIVSTSHASPDGYWSSVRLSNGEKATAWR